MFSKLIKKLQRNTAVDLTLRFSLVFLLCAAALFATVDFLLARAQLEKDQQLMNSFLESYQRLEESAGLHKLELVIERDRPYFQRTEMRVELLDKSGKPLLLAQPEAWSQQPLVLEAGQDSEDWLHAVLHKDGIRLLMTETVFSDGSQIRIGMSVAAREASLSESRRLMLSVMLPLLMLALLLTAYMNWRALRPVHDLIDTVRNLKATDLKARVLIRNPRSELGELAHLFNQMLSQIERLINGMQHSLDAVAHDLRTPLARMRLSLESALSQPDDSELREALLDCAEESERIETMLRVLMDISEAESGILSLHPESLELNTLVEETVELYSYLAEDKGVEIEIDSNRVVSLMADPVRLRQVLGNLLDNAIKYSEPGGKVSIRWSQLENQVVLEICDQGSGIAPEDQERVFDRLYRADESRTEPGMGLGLSLVKAVVQAHRGEIHLMSKPGHGSEFQVILPQS